MSRCDDCAPEFAECWNDGSKCRKRPRGSFAPVTGSAMSPERQGAYATIAAACFNGPIPAGHRAWLDAQTDEFVVTMADRLHSPNVRISDGEGTVT